MRASDSDDVAPSESPTESSDASATAGAAEDEEFSWEKFGANLVTSTGFYITAGALAAAAIVKGSSDNGVVVVTLAGLPVVGLTVCLSCLSCRAGPRLSVSAHPRVLLF